MAEGSNVLMIGSTAPRVELVRAKLAGTGLVCAEDAAQACACAQRLGARVAIVDLEEAVEPALAAMEELSKRASQVRVIALASRKDPDLILRAMRAGAREFVLLDDELVAVVDELLRQTATGQATGRILAVFPAKGGIGATFIATNFAGLLATAGRSVVLVDLDLELGDVLVTLDMAGQAPLSEVVQSIPRLDKELLGACLARHRSGLQILSQTDRWEESAAVTPAKVGSLLAFLARFYDYVVLDGLRGFDELAVAALDACQRVVLVTEQSVPAVKNTQRCLEVFRRLRYAEDKVAVVINRFQKSAPIDPVSLVDSLGAPIAARIANDYRTVMTAINRGLLVQELKPRSRLARDLRSLTVTVAGVEQPKRRGVFRKLFGGAAPAEPGPPTPSPAQGAEGEPERTTEPA